MKSTGKSIVPMAFLLGLSLMGCKSDKEDAATESFAVHLSPEPGQSVSSLQFDVSYDAEQLDLADVTLGVSAQDAEKQLDFSVTAPGNIRVVVYGMNQNVMEEGAVAHLVFEPTDSLDPDASSVALAQNVASDPNAELILSDPASPTVLLQR